MILRTRKRVDRARFEKTRFGVGLVSLMGVTALLCLALWASVVPLAFGWSSVAILSGSMAPGIEAGDVVLTTNHDGEGLALGAVIVFASPAGDGNITHRIVGITPSGDYVTRGDRNPRIDSDLVTQDQVFGVGRVLVPFIGKPYVWVHSGQWLELALASLAIALALWASRWAVQDRFDPWPNSAPLSAISSVVNVRLGHGHLVGVVTMVLLIANVTGVDSQAAFVDSTDDTGNSWVADVLQPATSVTAAGGASITIDWTATADTYATGHRVLRSTSPGGPYAQIAQVTPRTTTTYVDNPADGTYYYVVRSYYQNWESVDSNEASATAGIAFDDESSKLGYSSSGVWVHGIGNGGDNRILVVGVSFNASVSVSSVTFDAQSLSFIGGKTDPNGSSRMEMWYLAAPPTGNADVRITFSGATDYVGGATSWTGVHQSSPLGTFVSANGNSATASVNVSSAPGEVVVDTVANTNVGAVSIGSGQDEHWNKTKSTVGGGGSSEPGSGTTTMSWTMPSDFWAIGAVPLKPAP